MICSLIKEYERLRSKARHEEAQALHNARQKESEKWQSILADKDILIADKDKIIAELRARLVNDKI
jgi:hypothetical protein